MSKGSYMREGRFFHKEDDIEFDFLTVDGLGLPPFEPAFMPGGFPRRIREIQNLNCRTDDIILATYPKCGTHWTNEILNMLVKGDANYVKESKMMFMLEAVDDLNSIQDFPSPRVLNLHLPYKWFPRKHIENGGRIVHTTRNPKDAYVSFFHHAKCSSEHGVKTKDMTWAQFFDTCVLGKKIIQGSTQLNKGKISMNSDIISPRCCTSVSLLDWRQGYRNSTYGSWFDFEKEMEQAKKSNKNIYTVHFEELKECPERSIKELAVFLDVPTSETLIKDIADKCQFQNLKNADKEIKEIPPKIKELKLKYPTFEFPVMFRKGIVGDWKNHFTVSQNEEFDAMIEKELKGTCIKVLYN